MLRLLAFLFVDQMTDLLGHNFSAVLDFINLTTARTRIKHDHVELANGKLQHKNHEGMLLCAEDAEGNLSLSTPEKDMPAGAEIC